MHSERSVLPRPDEEPRRPAADAVREVRRVLARAVARRPDRET